MQVELETTTSDARMTLARRLRAVLLPGRLRTRAAAAAGLPTWLAVILATVSIILSVEVVGYISAVPHDFLQVMFTRWETTTRIPAGAAPIFLEVAIRHIKPHVIPTILEGPSGLLEGLSAAFYLAVLLESMNLVLMAPLAVGCGQKVTRSLRKTRRVLLALGGMWLLEWSVIWLVLFLATSALVLRIIEVMYIRISYTLLDDLTGLSFHVCLAGLLLAWVVRLVRAAACLAPPVAGPVTPRCSRCGYLLTGVPEGTACRECGLEDPAGPDRLRADSPWFNRRRIGRYRALARTLSDSVGHPATFYSRLRTLADVREGLQFLLANLWLSIAAWMLAVPGIYAALIDPDDIYITSKIVSSALITLRIAIAFALAGALLIGLLISLVGFAVNRTRDETAWPIATTAGCYLAAILPRIAAAQALWVTGLFTIEQVGGQDLWLHLARHGWTQTGIPWEVLLSLLFGAPTLVGFVWLFRTTIVCYHNIRFAGR